MDAPLKTLELQATRAGAFHAANGWASHVQVTPGVLNGNGAGGGSGRSLRLLDLFCCAGGAGEGYRRAGFDVTGVDIRPMPNNPHRFIQGDAIEYLADHGGEYDAIHASPPCPLDVPPSKVIPFSPALPVEQEAAHGRSAR